MSDPQINTTGRWPHGRVEVSDAEYIRITQEISDAYDVAMSETEPIWKGWVESLWFTCYRTPDPTIPERMLRIVAEQQLPGERTSRSDLYYNIQLLRMDPPKGIQFIVGDRHALRKLSPDPLAKSAA